MESKAGEWLKGYDRDINLKKLQMKDKKCSYENKSTETQELNRKKGNYKMSIKIIRKIIRKLTRSRGK